MKHTKNEWKMISATDSDEYAYIASGSQYVVSNIRKEIARRICQCVNSHDDLLEACEAALIEMQNVRPDIRRIIDTSDYDNTICVLGKAIAKAKDS